MASEPATRVSVKLTSGDLVHVDVGRYDHFRLAYCLNTWHAQGLSVQSCFLLTGGGMTSRELAYVQASRSRDETRIYTDRFSAGEGLEQLARTASKSMAKELAYDLLKEWHREEERRL